MRLFKIVLKDNQTNEEKEVEQEFIEGMSDEGIDYIITEGNYSCDCNRYDMFYPESDDDIDCGDERFSLVRYFEVKSEI